MGRRLSQGGARGVTALAAVAALTAGGGTAIGWATTHQDHAPQPTAAVAGTLDPPDAPSVDASREIGSATQSARATEPRPLQLPPSHPERLRIPAIELDSTLQGALGLNPDGTLRYRYPPPDRSTTRPPG